MPKDNRRASAERVPGCEKQVGPEPHANANVASDLGVTQLARRIRKRRELRKRMLKTAKSQFQQDDGRNSISPSGSGSGISLEARPSDSSFFTSASNIGIEGGQFSVDSSTHQSKTNLTINLLHNLPKESVNAYTMPFDSSSAFTSSRGPSISPMSGFQHLYTCLDHSIPDLSEPTFPSQRHIFNVLDNLAVDGSLSHDNHVENASNSNFTALDNKFQSRKAPSSTSPPKSVPVIERAEQHDSEFKVQESSDIYYRHLSVKKRGYPLWLPEPNYYLPVEYQRKGISVGDVGMLTTEGGFDYLFNVLLSHDHPFNAGRVPPDFAPLFPALDSSDIRGQFVFRSNSFIASPGVRRSFGSSGDYRANFSNLGSEGAILITPDGAVSEDLGNLSRLRQYMSENIESWYRYANGPRGRELANGDLRLVIGCDKTSAWGMAAFSKLPQGEETVTHLRFKSVSRSEDASRIKTYGWELHSGMAEVRSGPDLREIQALSTGDMGPTGEPRAYENQCIFVRTLNTTLNTAEWLALMAEIKVPDGSGTRTISQGDSSRKHSSEGSPGSRDLCGSANSCIENNPSILTDKTNNRLAKHKLAEVPVYLASHPSKLLHELILQQVTNQDVKMVITDDSDWSSVLTEDEIVLPNLRDLTKRILASSTLVRDTGGAMYLEKNFGLSSVQHSQPLPQISELPPMVLNDPLSFNESILGSVREALISHYQAHGWSNGNDFHGEASVSGGASHGRRSTSVGGEGGRKEGQLSAEQDMALIRTKPATTTNKCRKRVSAPRAMGKCHSCNIRETPEWRRGPDGASSLCNACGLHYAKLMRKSDKNVGDVPPPVDLEMFQSPIGATDTANGPNTSSSSAAAAPR